MVCLAARVANDGLLAIYERRRSDLRRFLVARSGSDADADDLMNELWIKVSGMDSGPIGNPDAYLFRMANNVVLDRIRETRRRERRERDWSAERHGQDALVSEAVDRSLSAEQALIANDEIERLRDAVGQLPPGAGRVLRMHKLEELGHGEIAAKLGISKSAVEKHMAVAMAHLRRILLD